MEQVPQVATGPTGLGNTGPTGPTGRGSTGATGPRTSAGAVQGPQARQVWIHRSNRSNREGRRKKEGRGEKERGGKDAVAGATGPTGLGSTGPTGPAGLEQDHRTRQDPAVQEQRVPRVLVAQVLQVPPA